MIEPLTRRDLIECLRVGFFRSRCDISRVTAAVWQRASTLFWWAFFIAPFLPINQEERKCWSDTHFRTSIQYITSCQLAQSEALVQPLFLHRNSQFGRVNGKTILPRAPFVDVMATISTLATFELCPMPMLESTTEKRDRDHKAPNCGGALFLYGRRVCLSWMAFLRRNWNVLSVWKGKIYYVMEMSRLCPGNWVLLKVHGFKIQHWSDWKQ